MFCHVISRWFLDSVFKPKRAVDGHEPPRTKERKMFRSLLGGMHTLSFITVKHMDK